MLAIFKRDFKSLFCNVIGFLFVGLMLSIFGLYFTVYNLKGASSSIQYTLIGIINVSLFAIPLLTMRSLSEERKQKTDQLLLTAPVSVFKIVFGKFLALVGVFSIVVGIICMTPLILSMFGKVDYVQNYIAILGFFLYGLVCISVGMFVSSFFESQILSAIVSFVFLFFGYMMNGISSNLNATGLTKKILGCYDFVTPLSNFMNGNFMVRDLIYDVSIVVLMLFLTCQGISKRRWSFGSKNLLKSVFSTVGVALAIAICIVINVFSYYIPKKYASFDLTSQKLYTLTVESKEYLNSLDKDIKIYVSGKESYIDDVVKKTLSNFDEASDHVSVEYIDTDTNVKFFSKYTEEDVTTGSLVVVYGDTSKVVSASDLYQSDVSMYSSTVTGYDGEGQIISAMQYVTQDEFTTIYVLEGHDEVALGSQFTGLMEKANWKVETLNLLNKSSVPKDCATLIINSPQTDFSEDDAEKVLNFVRGGGNVVLTYDYLCTNKLENYKKLTDSYGVSLNEDGIIFDYDMDYYYQNPAILLPNVEYSESAEDLYGNLMVVAPYAYAFNTPMFDMTITSLLTTSFKAQLEDVSMENLDDKMMEAEQKASEATDEEDDDYTGSYYILALMIEPENSGKLILYGTPYIFTDQFNSLVSGRNANLLMDNLKYLIGEEESNATVIIPVKNLQHEYLTVPQSALLLYGLLLGIVVPVLLIVFGIIFWAVRRRR